ncbi:unnamed protein product [Boreogadus saida]
MMYHKNRLIKAYHRVGCQKDASNKQGIGVIGVIECNFLEPTHNKQDFDNTDKYRNAIRSVANKLEEYFKEIRFKRKNSNPSNNVPIEEEEKCPDQNWAQCDKCQKWRRMPEGINPDKIPEEWFCYINPDPQFRHCVTMEEPEDFDSEQPANPKTYKIQEKEDKKKQEKTPTRQQKPRTPKEGASASGVSTSSSQPVITDVFWLSTPSRLKRLQPTTPQNESKRQKLDGPERKLVTDMSLSSSTTPPTPVPCEDLDIDDDPLEGSSTPEMTEPTFQPFEVRLENDPMDSAYVAFTSPRKSFVNEPTVTCTSTQMRDEEEMRDKIIWISDDEEEEMRDKSPQTTVKDEEEEEEMRDKSPQTTVKDEEEMNSSTAANDGAKVMEKGMISIIQAQEEPNQFMEHLQFMSYERDSLKEEVKEELEKQWADFQTAREKAEKLSREKEDQSSKEMEKLHLKVRQLEEEKATTAVEPQDHGRVGRRRSRSMDIPPTLSRSK